MCVSVCAWVGRCGCGHTLVGTYGCEHICVGMSVHTSVHTCYPAESCILKTREMSVSAYLLEAPVQPDVWQQSVTLQGDASDGSNPPQRAETHTLHDHLDRENNKTVHTMQSLSLVLALGT